MEICLRIVLLLFLVTGTLTDDGKCIIIYFTLVSEMRLSYDILVMYFSGLSF